MRKRILVTGKQGYIGNHIQQWLLKQPEIYNVEMLNLRADDWKNEHFKNVDVLIHTAAIVHQSNITDWEIYRKTNVDLSIILAQKAKQEGVRQFIFFSTMAVYGKGKHLAVNIIDEETEIKPISLYAKSKYLAEQEIEKLQSEFFKVVILRPPNVYGRNCKGGYITGFRTIVSKLPALPYAYLNVKQSMLDVVSAVKLMTVIADTVGLKKRTSRLLGIGIYLLSFLPIIKKAYGGIAYSEKMTSYFENQYVVVPFEQGIRRTLSNG